MKLQPKPSHLQFNLLLAPGVPAELPSERNKELVQALVELLISAAKESVPASAKGGPDESQADE